LFTGIIEAIGRIAAAERRGNDARLRIEAGALGLSDVKLGDSIAVSGVCLTVVEITENAFAADVSAETLSCTTLASWKVGDSVNLEKALLPTTRLGGHLVSGHVDGVGTVRARDEDGRSIRFQIEAPAALAKYIAAKGSICVDGVSLTVNAVAGATFDINVIPHTAAQTTFASFLPGRCVNLEVDVLARYLERLSQSRHAVDAASNITPEFLAQHGFRS